MISERSPGYQSTNLQTSKQLSPLKGPSDKNTKGKVPVKELPKRSLKGNSNKADGRAKVLGVAGLASLLQVESQPKASSSKITSQAVKAEMSGAKRLKRERSPDTETIAASETEARGKLLRLANQAINTSKTGFSLKQMKEEDEEKKMEKEAMKHRVASKATHKPSQELSTASDGATPALIHPVPGDDPLAVDALPTGKDTALRRELRDMVSGLTRYDRESQKVPGNYLAIDCEMVGLGHNGQESCLARVSIVNYHGYVVLDTFVRPRERVTDWRTWVSGVRPKDMNNARHFGDVQAEVAKLLDGKIVIGHAVENDTKALLLSHPSPLLRDTQRNTALRQLAKTKMPGLKKLTELELGIKIQSGAHSSVTDARATMALYRLHKAEWEQAMWKETQAFLARQKKGSAPIETSRGSRNANREPPAGVDGKRRKSHGDDAAPAKRAKKAGDTSAPTSQAAPGNWWET